MIGRGVALVMGGGDGDVEEKKCAGAIQTGSVSVYDNIRIP